MATQSTQEITLHLPFVLFERLAQTAAVRHQPVEHVITETLELSLPSPVAQAEEEMNRQVQLLINESEVELRARAVAHLPPEVQSRMSKLLMQNREGGLSTEENGEVERLLDLMEVVAAERVAALWLLQKRQSNV